jgi:cytochrome c1
MTMLMLFVITCTGCDADTEVLPKANPRDLFGSDPQVGMQKISYYGCASCHTIPGIQGADGLVGPSLEHLANRAYLGGVLENTPDNLVRWIQDPPAIDPKTAMPNVRVSADDARQIASYLYTLR